MLKTTGSRLFAALLGYLTLVILLLTLNPFYMRLPRHITIKYASGLPNLFLPSEDSFLEVSAIPELGSGKLDLKTLKDVALANFCHANAEAVPSSRS